MAGPVMNARRAHRPAGVAELAGLIAGAAAEERRLEIIGGGSKATIGAPAGGPGGESALLDMGAFAGVVDYAPGELVLTVGAATPLAEVEALLAGAGQMLAFEPFDHAALLGGEPARATIGGVVAAGVAGSRRLSAGGARDHVLGLAAVSGRGEAFVAGGKVVKNVTGYDLPKLLAGSWGRLAALTEITLKVLPAPRAVATVVIPGLDAEAAVRAMSRAAGSPHAVAAAAHLPGGEAGQAATLLRIEGFPASVAARCAAVREMFAAERASLADEAEAAALWRAVGEAGPLAGSAVLWRIHLPARGAAGLVGALERAGAGWLMDWAGGLVWTDCPDPAQVRGAAAAAGGEAMLVRAPAAMRAAVAAFHPRAEGVAALSRRLEAGFDPAGVFRTGRFGD